MSDLTSEQLARVEAAAWNMAHGKEAGTIYCVPGPWPQRISWASHFEQCRQVQVRKAGGPICPYTGQPVDQSGTP
jgi:hypothetical protein